MKRIKAKTVAVQTRIAKFQSLEISKTSQQKLKGGGDDPAWVKIWD